VNHSQMDDRETVGCDEKNHVQQVSGSIIGRGPSRWAKLDRIIGKAEHRHTNPVLILGESGNWTRKLVARSIQFLGVHSG